MNKIKTIFAGLALVAVAAGLFFSCEIGLGESVDTKAPSVTITSPAVDSVIAGTFTASGGASDETSLKSVALTFKETTSGTTYGPYEATIDSSAHTWSCVLNTKDSAGAYAIADGKYQITATATDGVGRTSVATTVYQIDNINPSVLITSPITYGTGNVTTFYKTIDIKGEVYDASTIKSVVVNILDRSTGAILDTATADGTDTWSARFDYSSKACPLSDNTTYNYNVVATDSAGNSNTYYFHRLDIYPNLAKNADGTVTFPSMYQLGRLDQGLTSQIDSVLTNTKLATLRHGIASTSTTQAYADFKFMTAAASTVQWLNLSSDQSTTAVIALDGSIVGSILPPSDGNSIDQSSVVFYVTNATTGVKTEQPSSTVKLTPVGTSLNFEVTPVKSQGAGYINVSTGNYQIDLSFTLSSGSSGSDWRSFKVSAGAPIFCDDAAHATKSATSKQIDIRADTTISGYLFKSNETVLDTTNALTLKIDSGAATVVAVDSATGYFTVPVTVDETGHTTDGTHSYVLTAIDGDVTSILSRTYNVDTKVPNVQLNMNPSDSTSGKYNGDVAIKGAITDDNTMKSVYWQVSASSTVPSYDIDAVRSGGTAGADWNQVGTNLNVLNAQWSSIAVGTSGDATRYLWVIACDKFGNVSVGDNASTPVANEILVVNQDTDKPKITLSNVTVGGAAKDNLLDPVTNNKILGTITDDDGLKTVVVSMTGPVSKTKTFNLSGTKPTTYNLSYTLSAMDDISNAPEGEYVVNVVATDSALDITGATGTFNVAVDKGAPALAVTSPAQDLYSSGTVAVKGTASDGSGVVTLKSGTTDIPITAGVWTDSINVGSTSGSYSKTYVATDKYGRESSAVFRYKVDADFPKVTVTTADSYIKKENPFLVEGGASDDTSGVSSIWYVVLASGAAAPTTVDEATWTRATGTTVWSATVNLSSSSYLAGDYYVYIAAKDGAGNYSDVIKKVLLHADADTPVISLDALPAYTKDGYTVSGSATDANFNTLTYTRVETSGASSELYLPSSGTITPDSEGKWSLPQLAIVDGSYTYEFTATDKAGRTTTKSVSTVKDTKAPEIDIVSITPIVANTSATVNGTITIKGTIADNDKVATGTYALWIDGSEVKTASTVSSTNVSNFSFTIPTNSYADGKDMTVKIVATDRAGNTATDSSTVVHIDQSTDTPKMTLNYAVYPSTESEISATRNLYGKSSNNTLTGTITDDDGIASVVVNIDGTDTTYNLSTKPASYNLTVSLAALVEGPHTITISVTDSALGASVDTGHTTTGAFWIGVDDGPPTLEITNTSDQFHTSGFSITGTASDKYSFKDLACDGADVPVATDHAWTYAVAMPSSSVSKTLTFVATDKFGRQTTKNFTYKFDLDAPTITPTTTLVAPIHYFDKTKLLAITGTAAESTSTSPQSGLSLVQYAVVSGHDKTIADVTSWLPASGSSTWGANIDLSSEADGPYTVFLTAVDVSGNRSAAAQYNVTADSVAPDLKETTIGSTDIKYRTAISLGGTVSDSSGIKSVVYSRTLSGVTTSGSITPSGTSWTLPESPTDAGTYQYTITATDNAGLKSTVTRTIVIDTTPPTAAITYPASDGLYIQSSSCNFKGSDSDSSGIKSITVSFDGGAPTSLTPANNWTYEKDLTTLTSVEGSHKLTVVVMDNADNTTTVNRDFNVDLADPHAALGVGSTAKGALSGTTYVREADFSLSASYDDSGYTTNKKIASGTLTVSKDGTVINTRTLTPDEISSGSFSYTQSVASATHADDGLYVYTLAVIDSASRTASISRTVRIDTTAPSTPDVTKPAAGKTGTNALSGETYTISGSASDGGSGVAKVYYLVDTTATASSTLSDYTAIETGNGSWSASIDLATIGEGQGKYLHVRSEDLVGNVSASKDVLFDIDQTDPRATITVSAKDSANSPLVDDTAGMKATKGYFILSGTADDDAYSPGGIVYSAKTAVLSWKKGSTAYGSASVSLAGSWSWDSTTASPALDDGLYTFTLTVTDYAGKIATAQQLVRVDTTPPTVSVTTPTINAISSGATYAISGSVTDFGSGVTTGDSVDSVTYVLVNGSTADSAANTKVEDTTWSKTLNFSGQGQKTLTVTAKDKVGNVTTKDAIVFYYDNAAPTLTVTSPSSLYITTGKVTFSGTWLETNSLSGISIYYKKDGGSTQGLTPIAGSSGFLTAQPWTSSEFTLADGSYDFTITATDIAGQTDVKTMTVIMDSTKPTVSVASIEGYQTDSVQISGTAGDTNLSKVEYQIDATTDGSWASAGASSVWTKTISITSFGDGSHTLNIRATDKAGWYTDTSTTFKIDRNKPDLAVTTIDGTAYSDWMAGVTQYRKAAFDVVGSSQDTNGVKALEISSDAGSNYSAVSTSVSPALPSSSAISWTQTVPVVAGDDGLKAIRIRATDDAGKQTVVPFSVYFDTTAPTFSVNNLVANQLITATTYNVTGGISDNGGSGLSGGSAAMQYRVGTTGEWSSLTLGSSSWSGPITLSEGLNKTVQFQATDAIGNVSTAPVTITGINVDTALPITTILHDASSDWSGIVYKKASFKLSGHATDNNGIASVVVTGSANSGVTTSDFTSGDWSIDSVTPTANGTQTYAIKVTDKATQTNTYEKSIVYDSIDPVLTVNAISGYQKGTISIGGTLTEANPGVVEYQLDSTTGTWTPATVTGSGTLAWSATLDLSSASETLHTLNVKATDLATREDNKSTTFNVDQTDPYASIDAGSFVDLGSGVYGTKDSFTLTGKAHDDLFNQSDSFVRLATSVKLSWTKDGLASGSADPAVDEYGSWTWASSTANLTNGSNDGLYVFTLTVTDMAGNKATAQKIIRVDTAAPTLTVTKPVADEATDDDTFDIGGTSRDTNGVGLSATVPVQYKLSTESETDWHTLSVSGISWSATTASLGSEGTKTLNFKSTDRLGNVATEDVTFYYDTAAPTFHESEVNTGDTQYRKDDLTFKGDISDSNTTAAPTISVKVTGETAVPVSYSGNVWTYVFDTDSRAEGTYTLVFTATDAAKKTTTVTRTVMIDRTAPNLSNLKSGTDDITTLASVWQKTSSISVSGTASDGTGSGIGLVEYFVSAGSDTAPLDTATGSVFSGTTSFNGTVTFSDNESNYLYIRATDKAGNKYVSAGQKVQVDTVAPTITGVTSTVSKVAPLSVGLTSTPTSVLYSNGSASSSLSATLTVADNTSKAYFAAAKIGNDAVSTGPYAATGSVSSGSATISGISLSGITATTIVYVGAKDNAGNWSTATPVNVLYDNVLPSVSITSPLTSADVNKTISISGMANDTTNLSYVNVMVLKAGETVNATALVAGHVYRIETSGTTAFTAIGAVANDAGTTFVATGAGTGTGTAHEWIAAKTQSSTALSGSIYNWTLTGFDTTDTTTWPQATYDASGDTGYQMRFGAIAIDAAGNLNCAESLVDVDQNSDRPVITMTNLAAIDGTTTLKMSNTVFGSITDDDGAISTLEISGDGTFTDAAYKKVDVVSGNWSYTTTGDGTKTLYFRVSDAATPSTQFVTTVSTTDNLLTEPKILPSTSSDGYGNTVVTYKVDNNPPEFASEKAIRIDRTSSFDFVGTDEDFATNTILGGGNYSKFALLVRASDANGIKSVKVKIPGMTTGDVSGDVTSFSTTAVETHSIDSINAVSTIKTGALYKIVSVGTAGSITDFTGFGAANSNVGTEFYASRDGTSSDGSGTVQLVMNAWITGTIDVSSLASGSPVITITVEDNSGLTSTSNRTVIVDNTAPAAVVNTPLLTTNLNGSVTVSGTASDDGSGLAKVEYNYGYDYITASRPWTSIATSLYAWSFSIPKIEAYANGTTAKDTNGDNIYELPLLIRTTDKAGNVETFGVSGESTFTYVLRVDPNGDIPSVVIVYPDPAATNRTMGGTIRIFGTATDDDGVDSVYMMIDVNGDGYYTTADVDSNGKDWYNDGAGQKVDGTYSWNQAINSKGEFNPTGSENRTIHFKVMVKDTNSTPTSSAWTDSQTIIIDKNAPQIGSTEALELKQYSDAGLTTVSASQNYVSNIWVKGQWYLTGTVWDDSGISDIQVINVSGGISGSLSGNPSWFTPYYSVTAGHFVIGETYKIESLGQTGDTTDFTAVGATSNAVDQIFTATGPGTGTGTASISSTTATVKRTNYRLKIPVGATTGSGAQSFTIKATDSSDPKQSSTAACSVNYDNTAPTITDVKSGGLTVSTSNPIVQSDYKYTFGSTSTEADSGIARIAFYFLRPGTTSRVYDPMNLKGSNNLANRTDMSNLVMIDALPRLALTTANGSSRPDVWSIQNATLLKNNTNIHLHGLIKIGGIDRLITGYDSTTGTVSWADSVPLTTTDAWIAYAQVVDNTTTETPNTDYGTTGYPTVIKNDDGDGMVETLEKSGGLYTWSASINSKNIPDGPIEVHYVAYDAAGNYSTGSVSSSVENSRPRLTKLYLGTDLGGDGMFSSSELTLWYSAASGSEPATLDIKTTPYITMKGDLALCPEFVSGGNGTLKYVWSANASDTQAWDGTTYRTAKETAATASLLGFTPITLSDSATTTYPNGIIISATDTSVQAMDDTLKLFSFTVWDETEETTQGSTSQWALINVPVNVDVKDSVPPLSIVQPFYWKSSSDNSLYGNSKTNGHIEIPVDTSNPAVSGAITVRGTAYDDQRLTALYVHIDGMTMTNLSGSSTADLTVGSDGYYLAATFSGGVWSSKLDHYSSEGWAFSASTSYLTQAGHLATWQLDWNTAKVANVAASARSIKVLCTDKLPNQSGASSTYDAVIPATSIVAGETYQIVTVDATTPTGLTAAGASSNTVGNIFLATKAGSGSGTVKRYKERPAYTVDVVPYISSITTGLVSSASVELARSALGKYPVRESEVIDVYGFNLNGSSTAVSLNGTALTVTAVADETNTHVKADIGTTAKSGALTVTVGATSPADRKTSLNNSNTNTEAYNTEANGINNDLLTDDRYLYVWSFAALVNSKQLTSPMMKMDSFGNYYLSYGLGAASMYFNKNGAESLFEQCYNKFQNTNVAFDASGNYYGCATDTDRVSNAVGGATSFTFYSRSPGNSVNGTGAHYSNGTNKRHLELSYNGSTGVYDINRVKIPKLAVTGSGTDASPAKVYMSYYDSNSSTNQVKFRYSSIASSADSMTLGLSANLTTNNPGTATGYQEVASSASTKYKGGLYTAVGATSTGIAVIVWYDASSRKLIYSYNDDPSGSSEAQWQSHAIEIDSSYSGWYVDMCVDVNDGIHIAYYNSGSGDLKYAFLSKYDDTTPEKVTVDSYLSTGQQISINTRVESRTIGGSAVNVVVPYISYYFASFTQTTSSVKVAWRNDFSTYPTTTAAIVSTGSNGVTNGATGDKFTGKWESMIIPTTNIPVDGVVCNGVPTSGDYASSVFLGYYTDAYYERAYYK